MIVMADVTTSSNDMNALRENLEKTEQQTGVVPEIVEADCGYGDFKEIQAMEDEGKTRCAIPLGKSTAREKDRESGAGFTYDPERDVYICIKGKKLKRTNRKPVHNGVSYDVFQAKKSDCLHCPLFGRCTSSKNGRALKVPHYQRAKEDYLKKLDTPDGRALIKERRTLIEHVFGTLKRWMGKILLLLTGKEKVQTEIDLYATAYNFRRLLSVESIPLLLQKMQNYAF